MFGIETHESGEVGYLGHNQEVFFFFFKLFFYNFTGV